jgi:hypothetical protein
VNCQEQVRRHPFELRGDDPGAAGGRRRGAELIEEIGLEAVKMPRDWADAVVALDRATARGETTADHCALTNCQDAAVYGADQLDPGRVATKTGAHRQRMSVGAAIMG